MPKKMVEQECHEDWHMHKKGKGWKMLILGLLVIGNEYWTVVNWAYFIGIVIALGGLLKLAKSMK